jgi:hypothetical protein
MTSSQSTKVAAGRAEDDAYDAAMKPAEWKGLPLPSAAQVRAYLEYWRDKLVEIGAGAACSIEMTASNFGGPGSAAKFLFYISSTHHNRMEFDSPMALLAEARRRVTREARTARLAEIRQQMETLSRQADQLERSAA